MTVWELILSNHGLQCNLCNLFYSSLLLKSLEAAVPPWVDSNDEETIQQQILALSAVSTL